MKFLPHDIQVYEWSYYLLSLWLHNSLNLVKWISAFLLLVLISKNFLFVNLLQPDTTVLRKCNENWIRTTSSFRPSSLMSHQWGWKILDSFSVPLWKSAVLVVCWTNLQTSGVSNWKWGTNSLTSVWIDFGALVWSGSR